jgi:hypothetical protein
VLPVCDDINIAASRYAVILLMPNLDDTGKTS